MKNSMFITLLLMIYLAGPLYAQEKGDDALPSWLLLQKGIRDFNDKEFGQALYFFRLAIEKEGRYPEADIWISRVFEESDAETDLAVEELLKAYNEKDQLFIISQQYSILYKLAELYRTQDKNFQYEDTLSKIILDDKEFSKTDLELIFRILREKGLDGLVKLYRFGSDFALKAHLMLGEYYYANGREQKAVDHLLYGVLCIFTKAIKYLREEDPDYIYSTLDNLLEIARTDNTLTGYFADTQFSRALFYLGRALFTLGDKRDAANIWNTLKTKAPEEVWRNLAARSLSTG